jgi:hypothetical protein
VIDDFGLRPVGAIIRCHELSLSRNAPSLLPQACLLALGAEPPVLEFEHVIERNTGNVLAYLDA